MRLVASTGLAEALAWIQWYDDYLHLQTYCIAGNFRGRKLLRILRAIRESFLHEILGHAAPTYVWFQTIRESFLREILTPSKVYRYTVHK